MATNHPNPVEIDDEALDKALADSLAAAKTLAQISDDEITNEQISELEAEVNFANEAKAEKANRAEKKQARDEKLQALRSAAAEDDSEQEGEAPAEEPQAAADESTEEHAGSEEEFAPKGEKPKEEEDTLPVVIDVPPSDEEIPTEETPSEEDEDEKKKETAAVSENGKASLADAAKHAPKSPAVGQGSTVSLTAAANVPNVPHGKEYDSLPEAAGVVTQAMRNLPTSGKSRTVNNALVFSIDHPHKQGGGREDLEVMLSAADEHKLEGGSLVAAGGWAAPSEQFLDFCSIEKADGLIDLPGITVNRGGVQYTKGPSFEDVMDSNEGFWDMTEAVAEAGSELKTSLRPSVPEFTDVRLDAVGVMVEAGILTRHGWPELVERYVKLAVLAHQFKVHHKTIAALEEYTGAATSLEGQGAGNALDVLHILDVVAAGERQRYAMGQTDTLEVILPIWVKSIIRADLANRAGVDLLEVNDARINAFFSARQLRVQFLNHYQPLGLDPVAQGYPGTVEAIMYPAGTFVRGMEDVLTLDTVYDSTNLKKNDYVALFMEQGILVANPCYDGRRVSLPLAATGRTSAADITGPYVSATSAP